MLDLAHHFIERWNHARSLDPEAQRHPALCGEDSICEVERADSQPEQVFVAVEDQDALVQYLLAPVTCKLQVVRSVSHWSAGASLEANKEP